MLVKNKLKNIILLFVLFFTFNLFGENNTFKILNLHSDDSTSRIAKNINSALISELKTKNYELYSEYINIHNSDYKDLFDFYSKKYVNIKFDIILSSGNSSYEFLSKYKNILFPNTHVILGNISEEIENIKLDYFTIIKEEQSINRLLSYINNNHNIYVLSDKSKSSKIKINKLKKEISNNENFKFIFSESTDEKNLFKEINKLENHINIVIYSFNEINKKSIVNKNKLFRKLFKNKKNIYSFNENLSNNENILLSFFHNDILLGKTYALIVKTLMKGNILDKNYLHYDLRTFSKNINDQDNNTKIKENSAYNELKLFFSLYAENKLLFTFLFLLSIFCIILFIGIITRFMYLKNEKKEINVLNYEIEENEKKIISLTENLPGLVYRSKNIFYEDIEYLSKGIFDLTGYTKEQIINQDPSYEDLILDKYKLEHKNKISNAISSKSTYYIKYEIKTFDNKIKSVSEKGHAIYNSSGELLAIEGYISDITELNQAQNKIIKMNVDLEHTVYERTVELEESNKELQRLISDLQNTHKHLLQSEKMASLGSLVAGVAHEVNTPIGLALMGTTHFLDITNNINDLYRKKILEEDDFEEYLETSLELAQSINFSLEKSVDLIKSFKQIAVDQSSEEMRTFNMKNYLEEILLSIQNKTKKTKHKIIIKCEKDIILTTYPGAISQIITNLIMNSIIHGFKNINEGLVIITAEKIGKKLYISFRDNGSGIEEKNIKIIFDPFFTTARDEGGSGLGLNVLYNLITTKLKGTIDCTSKVNFGTEFKISFMTK